MHHPHLKHIVEQAEAEARDVWHSTFLHGLLGAAGSIVLDDIENAEPGVTPLVAEFERLRTMPAAERHALIHKVGQDLLKDAAEHVGEFLAKRLNAAHDTGEGA